MRTFILKRLFYMVPTLVGISLVVFCLIQFVPGGPVEQYISKLQSFSEGRGANPNRGVDAEEIENIKAYYGFDQPAHLRYLKWIKKVCVFDFGTSYFYSEPVLKVISERFPISIFFGLTSFILTYTICIPLGVLKAIKHGSFFDLMSSFLVFAGFVIPSYALGVLFIIFFCGGSFWDIFPMTGIVSDNYEELGFFEQIWDFLHHMFLPLICYMIGEFAFLTFLMKNSLLEEIKKDYMRTALVKGSSFSRAIWRHALRNSLIPLATRLSELFTIMFAGSVLIEKVFDIDGIGLLSYNAIVDRDYPIAMAIIFLGSLMSLLGRLFSDVLYAYIDPRIRFK